MVQPLTHPGNVCAIVNEQRPHLLILEDDVVIAAEIASALVKAGYRVTTETDGAAGLHLALEGEFDTIVVDRILPGLDGLSVVTELRHRGIGTPILILSALGTACERVEGLTSGSDDYLVKPFDLDELLARLAAIRRRGSISLGNFLSIGFLKLDVTHQTASCGDQHLSLTPREFRMLEYFALNPGQVITRKMLLEKIWNYRHALHENLVEVHISNLRRKLDGRKTGCSIQTIRSRGFVLRVDT